MCDSSCVVVGLSCVVSRWEKIGICACGGVVLYGVCYHRVTGASSNAGRLDSRQSMEFLVTDVELY